jgi:hypothetical protein
MTSKKKNKAAKQAESPKTKTAASSSPPSSPPAPATPPDADKLEASSSTPPDADKLEASSSTPPDADKLEASSSTPPDADELEASDTSPTEVLMGLLFEAWIAHRFAPCFHWMTRTFGHHRVGDKYDTNKIFDQLDRLGAGDHSALLDELEAFRDTCFRDLAARLADRDQKA